MAMVSSTQEATMVEPTLILLGLCGFAIVMVAAAGLYYHVNRDKLGA